MFSGQCTDSWLTENGRSGGRRWGSVRVEIMGWLGGGVRPDSNAPGGFQRSADKSAMNGFAVDSPCKLREDTPGPS